MAAILALLAAAIGLAAAEPPAAAPDAGPAAGALGAALDSHRLVAIGESHGSARFHAFLQALLRKRDFVCRIDDIVVEFGNARLQPVADRYTAGRRVARRDKVRIWRDTGQFLVWDSPVYEAVFDRIRAINRGRFCRHPIRVVLGDPPIPWERVRNAADYRPYAQRDQAFADAVEREVIAKGRRALLIAGTAHILKGHPREFTGSPTAAEIIESRHPGLLFSLLPLFDPAAIAAAAAAPGLVTPIRASALAGRSYGPLASSRMSARVMVDGKPQWRPMSDLDWPAADRVVDAVIGLPGEDHKVAPDPATYRDAAYRSELRRRAAILSKVYGGDFGAELDEALRDAGVADTN